MDKFEQRKIINNIISEEVHGSEFYNQEYFKELCYKVEKLVKELDLSNGDDASKITRVNQYLIKNVKVRKEYFEAFLENIPEIPQDELIYRTAYAALIRKEAMCAGFTEAARILLEIAGLKTKTLLSKLPGKNKHLLHYVTAIKYDRGSGRDYYIMDPERERSCTEKGFDFRRYLMEMTYIKPDENFYANKIGKNGVGIRAGDYLEKFKPQHVLSKNEVDKLFIGDEPKND